MNNRLTAKAIVREVGELVGLDKFSLFDRRGTKSGTVCKDGGYMGEEIQRDYWNKCSRDKFKTMSDKGEFSCMRTCDDDGKGRRH